MLVILIVLIVLFVVIIVAGLLLLGIYNGLIRARTRARAKLGRASTFSSSAGPA